ncbi:hypothetical protein [Flagellimonas marina]|uniref:3-keto-disaccharide hydrolase domain-containing protein n=1 Tax=Flagellimonas marina TaxID=1775168 RepID=A0ABV8PMS8_9FLAO
MNNSINKLVSVILCVAFSFTFYAQGPKQNKPVEFPFTEKYWSALTDNVEFTTYKSVSAAKSTDGNPIGLMLKDFDFSTGTIEFDVELKGRGFPGITFHVDKDTLNSETFYLRYFGKPQPQRRNNMQYAAVVDKVNLWDLTDDYQAAAQLYENQWNHIKLVISENQMRAYVNDMENVALWVPALEGLTKSGGIGLSGDVVYANMVVTPNAIEGIPSSAGYDPTANDSRYLRNWLVSEPINFPFGKDLMKQIVVSPGVVIDSTVFGSTWKPLQAGQRSMVNLTKKYGGTKQGERRLAWLKTTITSDKMQKKKLNFGFNDEVWVFINGKPLYIDKNYYGTPGMKEPLGRATIENTIIEIPLQEGENEILIGLTSYFYGWGMIARWENNDGISF